MERIHNSEGLKGSTCPDSANDGRYGTLEVAAAAAGPVEKATEAAASEPQVAPKKGSRLGREVEDFDGATEGQT